MYRLEYEKIHIPKTLFLSKKKYKYISMDYIESDHPKNPLPKQINDDSEKN